MTIELKPARVAVTSAAVSVSLKFSDLLVLFAMVTMLCSVIDRAANRVVDAVNAAAATAAAATSR